MESYEIYEEEKYEAQACGVRDFPTYSEWLHNLHDPHAERKRAEDRLYGVHWELDDYQRDLD